MVCSRADVKYMCDVFKLTMDQVDSFLGATVQLTRYSKDKKVILQDDSKDEEAQVISGFRLLSNNQVCVQDVCSVETENKFQVNVVSSVVCAGIVGWLGG